MGNLDRQHGPHLNTPKLPPTRRTQWSRQSMESAALTIKLSLGIGRSPPASVVVQSNLTLRCTARTPQWRLRNPLNQRAARPTHTRQRKDASRCSTSGMVISASTRNSEVNLTSVSHRRE